MRDAIIRWIIPDTRQQRFRTLAVYAAIVIVALSAAAIKFTSARVQANPSPASSAYGGSKGQGLKPSLSPSRTSLVFVPGLPTGRNYTGHGEEKPRQSRGTAGSNTASVPSPSPESSAPVTVTPSPSVTASPTAPSSTAVTASSEPSASPSAPSGTTSAPATQDVTATGTG